MVISCSAYGCSNKWSRQGPIHFHKFPFRSRVLCEKWISALKRKDFVPTRASLVCSAHFTEDDYVKKPELTKKRLRNDAVPSVFNFPINDLSSLQLEQCTPTSAYNENGKKRRSKKIYNPIDDVDFDSFSKLNQDSSLLSEITSVAKQNGYTDDDITFVDKAKSLEAKDIDSFIRELVVYEEVDLKNNTKPEEVLMNDEELSIDDIEDDLARMAEADEDDKCYIIGSIWGERFKQLPADSRPKVKKLINQVFEEARKGTLSAQFNVFESH